MPKQQKLKTQTVKKWGIEFTKLDWVFPSEKYKKYLEKFGIKDDEKLDAKTIEELFLIIRADFFTGKLDLNEFALISNLLLWIMEKRHFDDDNIALANRLEDVKELGFDIRTQEEKILKYIPDRLKRIYSYEPESGIVNHGSSNPSEKFCH